MTLDTEDLIRLEGLSKTYSLGQVDIHALVGVDLCIRSGEFVAVTGPSGSGKTTMMNLIGLIDSPTSGRIIFDGRDYTNAGDSSQTSVRLAQIGFVFQSFNLLPILSVYENVEMPLLLGKKILPAAERRHRVESMVKEVGLKDWSRHKPAELSGGQRQRVAIARALATEPKLVIADEPTANLDSETGRMILELMRRINQSHGTTFLFSTHDDSIRDMADHVVGLKDGRIIHDSAIHGLGRNR